jgi:hypothetical protein
LPQQNTSATAASDQRRASIDYLAQLHLVLAMVLYPDQPVSLMCRTIDIPDLITELNARRLRAQADLELLNAQIARVYDEHARSAELRKAKKRAALAPFLTKEP